MTQFTYTRPHECQFPESFDRTWVSWENKPTTEEEVSMRTQAATVEQVIGNSEKFIFPSSLMENFDACREEEVRRASAAFTPSQLAWFLDLANRFRGPQDRKDSLMEVFDPCMFTVHHPAWEAAPGTRIELPSLTSDVAAIVDRRSQFAEIVSEEINLFRNHSETYADEEVIGLARIAAAGLADQSRVFKERHRAIRYVALNASARLEDLWAADDTPWRSAPSRVIEFGDVTAKRKAAAPQKISLQGCFQEKDFTCYSERELCQFAFDIHGLFLTDRAKHLAVCTRCLNRLESWTRRMDSFKQNAAAPDSRTNA